MARGPYPSKNPSSVHLCGLVSQSLRRAYQNSMSPSISMHHQWDFHRQCYCALAQTTTRRGDWGCEAIEKAWKRAKRFPIDLNLFVMIFLQNLKKYCKLTDWFHKRWPYELGVLFPPSPMHWFSLFPFIFTIMIYADVFALAIIIRPPGWSHSYTQCRFSEFLETRLRSNLCGNIAS